MAEDHHIPHSAPVPREAGGIFSPESKMWPPTELGRINNSELLCVTSGMAGQSAMCHPARRGHCPSISFLLVAAGLHAVERRLSSQACKER